MLISLAIRESGISEKSKSPDSYQWKMSQETCYSLIAGKIAVVNIGANMPGIGKDDSILIAVHTEFINVDESETKSL
jgi:hypothetical protein